jgi:hypothetical protein
MSTSKGARNFSLDEPQYDLSRYTGRVQHFFSLFNPVNSFYSKAQIEEMSKVLAAHRQREAEAGGKGIMLS